MTKKRHLIDLLTLVVFFYACGEEKNEKSVAILSSGIVANKADSIQGPVSLQGKISRINYSGTFRVSVDRYRAFNMEYILKLKQIIPRLFIRDSL